MKIIAIKSLTVVALCFLTSSVLISQNLHHFFIEDTYQRSYFNPALNNKYTVSVATGFEVDALVDGPSLRDLTRDAVGGGLILDPDLAIENMNEENSLFASAQVNTLDISVDFKAFRLSVGHAWKASAFLEYTKDLAELIAYGNAPYIGETMNISTPIDYLNYNEVYLGLQKEFGPVSVGTRIKHLSGIQAIRTERSKINLTTSDDIYQLTLDNDLFINTANTVDYTAIDSFDIELDNISFNDLFGDNTGLAFDIGASMALGDRLEVSLSVLDIGGISWKDGVNNYSSVGEKTRDGLDLSDIITNDEEVVVEDSIRAFLDLDETAEEFETSLPTRFYLGGTFRVNDRLSVGALIQSTSGDFNNNSALALNASFKLANAFTIGGLYSAKKGNAVNFGLFMKGKIGPVHTFLSTDNLLGYTSGLDSKGSNLRFGISVGI